MDENTVEMTNMTNSSQQAIIPAYMFDEIEKAYEGKQLDPDNTNISAEAANIHHLALFDCLNEALD